METKGLGGALRGPDHAGAGSRDVSSSGRVRVEGSGGCCGARQLAPASRMCPGQLPLELQGDSSRELLLVGAMVIYFSLVFCKKHAVSCGGVHPGEGAGQGLFRQSPGPPLHGIYQGTRRLGGSVHTSAAILAIGFCTSPAPWVLKPMLPAAQPACPCHMPVGAAGAVTALVTGDCARGAIKETMKLLELLGRCLLRSLPEPGWSPACKLW